MKLQDRAEVGVYCPQCSPPPKLVVHTNRQNGTQFLGCPNWPKCDHTQEIPEDIKMQAAGARRLPGF